jgi:hypothetical protein
VILYDFPAFSGRIRKSNVLQLFWSWRYNYLKTMNSELLVSMLSGYGLDVRAIQVRSPAEAKDFSSNLCIHTVSGAHPASCPMGNGGLFPRGKARPWRDADHSPRLVPTSWMSRSYTSPSCAAIGVSWGWFAFFSPSFLIWQRTVNSNQHNVSDFPTEMFCRMCTCLAQWKFTSVYLPTFPLLLRV